jgi:hypothetical protein
VLGAAAELARHFERLGEEVILSGRSNLEDARTP